MQDEERLSGSSAFGTLLRHYRIAAGLSQEALAERAGMSTNGIGALERGYRRSPQRETLALLARGLALNDEQRHAFEAAARSQPVRIRGLASHAAGAIGSASTIPLALTSFVGRERELEELRAMLARSRLVTIAGAGGMGKTRLSQQLSSEMMADYSDGAWFVELSALTDPALVAQTIAAKLNVREVESEPIADTLLHHLGRRRMLLVIDNAEHLLEAVRSIVTPIVTDCAGITILVTSREPLHVANEAVYRLAPMPDPPALADAAALALHDSTRLFLDRARAASPRLSVTDKDADEIASICRKLEGMPLAIELAAARVRMLSFRQLNERLAERLPILASRDGAEERHRTLRATIDWSYRLLDGDEKAMFAKLAVFVNGFTLDACEAVAPAKGALTLDVLESLVEKSFVNVDPNEESPRFRALDLMREYGRHELTASGHAEPAMRAHAAYYAELVGKAVRGEAATAWYRLLDDETHNIRVALDWCAKSDAPLGARAILNVSRYWRVRANLTEARARLSEFLSIAEVAGRERAQLLCCAASFANIQDDFDESFALSSEALAFFENAGDPNGIGEAQLGLAEMEHRKGHLDAAETLYRAARSRFVTTGNERNEVLCIANLGMIARQRGEFADARKLLDVAHARAAASGENRIAGELLTALGWVNLYLGDLETSRRLFEQVAQLMEAERDPYGVCGARQGLGTVALKAGRLDEAFAHFVATVDAAFELRVQNYVFRGFHGVSAVLALQGQPEAGALYLGLAERLFAETGRELRDSIAYDIALQATAENLSPAEQARLSTQGAAKAVAEAVAELRDRTESE